MNTKIGFEVGFITHHKKMSNFKRSLDNKGLKDKYHLVKKNLVKTLENESISLESSQ